MKLCEQTKSKNKQESKQGIFVMDFMSILTPITELKLAVACKNSPACFMWTQVAQISSALMRRADHSHPGS